MWKARKKFEKKDYRVRPTTNDTTIPVWLAATIATIKIKGTTGNSKFMVTYRFNQCKF